MWPFNKKIAEIWKEDKRILLRSEHQYAPYPFDPIDTFNIYAIYETSLTTGNTRIREARIYQW